MRRGDVYWVDLEPASGSEANKLRPCVIVSRDASNRVSTTLTVVPITPNAARVYPFEVCLTGILDRPCKAQANQVRTVSKGRIQGEAVARLDPDLMGLVDEALRLHLAL